MKSEVAVAVVLAGAVFISANASADANLDLAKAKQCLSCHAVDKTTLAPSFQSMALKYKGQLGCPFNRSSRFAATGGPAKLAPDWADVRVSAVAWAVPSLDSGS